MTAAVDYSAEFDEQAACFDDTDGAYQVVEPDPFGERPDRRPIGRTSLRAEIRADQPRAITELARSAVPPLPVPDGLRDLLPDGLRRGSTIAVTSSVSLLLTLVGTASEQGAWTALVGMPAISAEAAVDARIELSRLAIISPPDRAGATGWSGAEWTTAVGALLDAVDIVIARPGIVGSRGAISDGDARRLTARARSKDAVLVLFGQQANSWPAVETHLSAQHHSWTGIGDGYGRLAARKLTVSMTGRGRSSRPRSTELWLPITAGMTSEVESARVSELRSRRSLSEAG